MVLLLFHRENRSDLVFVPSNLLPESLLEDTLVLQLVPQNWFSWNFDVLDDDRLVASIKVSSLPESGTFSFDGTDYRAYREGIMSGDFFLASDGQTIARAQKPSAFLNTFEIQYSDRSYTLKKKSLVGRSFVLFESDREVGSIRPEALLSRKSAASLPETMPGAVQVFVIWLAILMWRRETNAGAAAAASG